MQETSSSDTAVHSWIMDLRARLSNPAPRRLAPSDARPAAVLVPLYVDAGQLWTLLTKRSETLPHHKGQIAFPGGGLETGESAWDAALRETEEEIGVVQRRILRLGELDESQTPSGYRIVPCVGAVAYPVEPTINRDEIDEVFSVPLTAFANPTAVEERVVSVDGVERALRVYHVGGRAVWGLTARIIQQLLIRLGLEPVPEDN